VETTRGEETILVVDDDKMIRDLAVEMLSQSGYTVITAPSGETAIEAFRKQSNRIALVILDLIMPGMDGKRCLYELLRFNPEARIIIASGYVDQELGTEMLKLGAKGLVGKPYDIARMLKVVRTTLDEGRYGLEG